MKTERVVGIILLILVLVLAIAFLPDESMVMRMVIGLGFGYVLSRASTGFAGGVNRAYRFGSTKLMRAMAMMFFITSIIVAGALIFVPEGVTYKLGVLPINLGTILGGLLFGFGMSLSSCCASGVLTDLASGWARALITLFFFMVGVFVGFPIQNTASWINESWFTSSEEVRGVFFPDWFKFDGMNGYLGAIILTGLLALLVVHLFKRYEQKRKAEDTFVAVESEEYAEAAQTVGSDESKEYGFLESILIKPWTVKQGAIALTVVFGTLYVATRAGWGVSTPYGIWFGNLLHAFGVPLDSLNSFTAFAADKSPFGKGFFANAVSVQNLGILLGTIIYALLSGKFLAGLKSENLPSGREWFIYILGGFTMGFGTRLSNGCNAGALFTPISQFSLSGWIFLIVMAVGAVIGNRIFNKKAYEE
ncbi:MAG TPA: YeeE/YedE family protein [Clostridiaceae bacterium]|nr:YeeE/YedE family protein [Clostridiaceae bacterium]